MPRTIMTPQGNRINLDAPRAVPAPARAPPPQMSGPGRAPAGPAPLSPPGAPNIMRNPGMSMPGGAPTPPPSALGGIPSRPSGGMPSGPLMTGRMDDSSPPAGGIPDTAGPAGGATGSWAKGGAANRFAKGGSVGGDVKPRHKGQVHKGRG